MFEPALSEHPLILDIGGNTVAADSREFHETLPGAEIHIYEPVPAFVEELKRNWADLPKVAIHGRGLGDSTRTVYTAIQDLAGQASFVMEGETKQSESSVGMEIVDAEAELRGYLTGGRKMIDLLHMNCEGCEWEPLERLIATQMLQHV